MLCRKDNCLFMWTLLYSFGDLEHCSIRFCITNVKQRTPYSHSLMKEAWILQIVVVRRNRENKLGEMEPVDLQHLLLINMLGMFACSANLMCLEFVHCFINFLRAVLFIFCRGRDVIPFHFPHKRLLSTLEIRKNESEPLVSEVVLFRCCTGLSLVQVS